MNPSSGECPLPVTDRPLGGQADSLSLRQFLIDTYALAGREFNWEPRRWEGMFWTVAEAQLADPGWGAGAHVWHTQDGSFMRVDVVHVANWGSADAGHLHGDLGFEHYATQAAWRTIVLV